MLESFIDLRASRRSNKNVGNEFVLWVQPNSDCLLRIAQSNIYSCGFPGQQLSSQSSPSPHQQKPRAPAGHLKRDFLCRVLSVSGFLFTLLSLCRFRVSFPEAKPADGAEPPAGGGGTCWGALRGKNGALSSCSGSETNKLCRQHSVALEEQASSSLTGCPPPCIVTHEDRKLKHGTSGSLTSLQERLHTQLTCCYSPALRWCGSLHTSASVPQLLSFSCLYFLNRIRLAWSPGCRN